MRVLPAILIAFAAGMSSVAAVASAKVMSPKEMQKIRDVATAFGDCVVKRNAPVARAAIMSNLENGEIKHSAYRLFDGNCLVEANEGTPAIMSFRDDHFRYTMAEALVRSDYPIDRHFDFSSVPPLKHFSPEPIDSTLIGKKAQKAAEHFAKGQAIAGLSRYGECVCRENPDQVHKLLLAKVGSDAELTAFHNLADTLGACLADGQLKFARETLRGLLALNFYRLAGSPTGGSVATLKVKS